MESTLRFDSLLLSLNQKNSNWLSPAFVSLSSEGKIKKISDKYVGSQKPKFIEKSLVIPGFLNAHSHSFQFAMAGQSEYLSQKGGSDDFWSWREAMYQLALKLTPDDLYIVAKACFGEMLRAGYTEVLEFHYLHNKIQKNTFEIDLQLPLAVLRAAHEAGIGITLVPVFYHNGDFDEPAQSRQKRFIIESTNIFATYLKNLADHIPTFPHARLGWGIHSLRAASQAQIFDLFDLELAGPMHIHAAEQIKEVERCKEHWGKAPISWLSSRGLLGPTVNIVHATHATHRELNAIVESHANVVLCPSTEGNLGDGYFDLDHYLHQGGSFAIGTDSQINFNPFEELRFLDYQLRLKKRQRNVLCQEKGSYSANILLHHSYMGGLKAFGYDNKPLFQVGDNFNALVLDLSEPLLSFPEPKSNLSAIVYGGTSRHIKSVYSCGTEIVKAGQHRDKKNIKERYAEVLKKYQR